MTRDDTTLGPTAVRDAAPDRWTLRTLFSVDAIGGALLALRQGDTPIGRGVDEVRGLCLDDPRLSREHAVLSLDGERLAITNKSKRGTLRNGAPVTGAVALHDGDVLQLGDTFLLARRVPGSVVDTALPAVVGVSPAAARLRATVKLVAPSGALVLLRGPTGAGKDHIAAALHEQSARAGAFVIARADAWTAGGIAASFSAAARGTLYLDEVGDVPLSHQPALLRAIDGAAAADVRVIAASHMDLDARLKEGALRADLYARLAEIVVPLPSLAQRREDVLPLLAHALPKRHPPLEPALVAALLLHAWPFNVREVHKLATELAVRGGSEPTLGLALVAARLPVADGDARASPAPDKAELERLLHVHGGVISEIARATGRSRKQVHRWLDKHGLRRPGQDDDDPGGGADP